MPARRKPTALKLLHGDFEKNPQRRPVNEPTPDLGEWDCPESLRGQARYEWRRVTKVLARIKVLTEADRSAIVQCATIWGEWYECNKIVEKEGAFLSGESQLYEHPASRKASRLHDQLLKLLIQFGLTPAARSRVQTTTQSEPVRMRRQR